MSGQLLSSGVTFGAIYAMVALGYHLIYVSSGILNFALGEQLAMAGLIALSFHEMGLPMPVAIVVAVLVGGLVGLVYERLALAPAERSLPGAGPIITSIGVALMFTHGRTLIWGPNPRAFPPFSGEPNASVDFLGGRWLVQSFWVIGLVAIITIMLLFFLRRTFVGRQWRAAAQNPTGARLCGVNPVAVSAGAVVMASLLVTLGGIAIAPIVLAGGFYGLTFGVKGFVAAILGGFESTGGAIIGGMTIGILESFLVGRLSNALADIILFAVLILMLIVRPKGLIAVRNGARA